MKPALIYSNAHNLEAVVLKPVNKENQKKPAIVFVQGSGFGKPVIYTKIPHLARYAKAGYVVMSICHRSCREGHPFPAYLEDVKCGIRYLRAHAEEYGIDPEKIGILGTSSGANAAMLAAMTSNDPRYKTEEYAEYSDHVACAAECFGPSLMEKMPEELLAKLRGPLSGSRDAMEVMREMSPYYLVNEHSQTPPLLILHGDADPVVPYEQGKLLYDKMTSLGKNVEMIRIEGADHESSSWSEEVYALIHEFFDQHLKTL